MANRKIHKIVMFQNGIETLDFFSRRLREEFLEMGYQIFSCDMKHLESEQEKLLDFLEENQTVMFTFNFQGLGLEEDLYKKEDGYIWQKQKIPCFNMIVDHPMYYHTYFHFLPPQYYHISIDRYHETYVKKYYPYVKSIGFLPHAGSEIDARYKPFSERKFDVVFTGNYTSIEKCKPYFQEMGEEYEHFYQKVAQEALWNSTKPLEEVMYDTVTRDIEEPTNLEFAQLMHKASFLDLYLRCYIRGRVIASLVDHGIKVHVFGDGWEDLECLSPENLIITREISSYACLEVLSEAKIALNIMPWFKDGAHDRIFNSILNGAYCVTDHSVYLDEIFTGDEVGFYEIDYIEKLPLYIKRLLENTKVLETKSQMAYNKVKANHTWEQRAKALVHMFETYKNV